MTPEDLETRLGDHPASSTVEAVLAELRVDPDWTVTEYTLEGRLVRVELLYHSTGEAFTLGPQGAQPRGRAVREKDWYS
jgi:hypothetical protein